MSNTNFTDILNEINNTKATISCYVPSRKENVQLLPLTLSQQKSIIETSVDASLAALFFNNTFFKILKQNIKGDISKYDTVDRVQFALQLRSQLSNSYTNNGVEYSLSDVVEKNKNLEYNISESTIVSENYVFTIKNPNLMLDDRINSILITKYKNENLNGAKLKNLISDLFVHEILKFIPKLKVNDKEIELHHDLQGAANLLEKIDSIRFVEITKYINTVRDLERSFAVLPGTNINIDIVPDFFIV